MMRAVFIAIVVLVITITPTAYGVDPDIVLDDPKLEARARSITQQLRCPTCVSQSVDSSNVGISRDLQLLVRERVLAGETDQEILDYVASRYGDFVLLRPRMSLLNGALWLMPVVVFLGAVSGLIVLRRRSAHVERDVHVATTLTDNERQQIEDALNSSQ